MIESPEWDAKLEVHDALKGVITQLRRGHVSKFPIRMGVDNSTRIRFFDPRFPQYDLVARLRYGSDNKGGLIYEIESPFITNDKYAVHSNGYHRKVTKDPKVALKTLKEVVRPYDAPDIAQRTVHEVRRIRNTWVSEAKWDFHESINIEPHALIDEINNMVMAGYVPKTTAFANAMTKGLEARQEAIRREALKVSMYHVLVNPNGVVIVTKERQSTKTPAESTTYQSMEECPEFVQQQVSLLRLVETVNTYVPQVGVKLSAIEYWVELEGV